MSPTWVDRSGALGSYRTPASAAGPAFLCAVCFAIYVFDHDYRPQLLLAGLWAAAAVREGRQARTVIGAETLSVLAWFSRWRIIPWADVAGVLESEHELIVRLHNDKAVPAACPPPACSRRWSPSHGRGVLRRRPVGVTRM